MGYGNGVINTAKWPFRSIR